MTTEMVPQAQQPRQAWIAQNKVVDAGPREAGMVSNGVANGSGINDDGSHAKQDSDLDNLVESKIGKRQVSNDSVRRQNTKESAPERQTERVQIQAPKFLAELDAMKASLYDDLDKKEYYVKDFYKETGIVPEIAKSDWFGNVTLVVIMLNAIWIGIDTDHNKATTLNKADLEFQIAEHLFCTLFTTELLIRFLSFKEKVNCLRDGWFKFDTFLVTSMVIETWILPIIVGDGDGPGIVPLSMLRLLRLLRLSRMARLARSFPELVTLLRGMFAALRSVGSTIVLLILFMYVFGIVFAQQSKGIETLEEIFIPLPQAMFTLLVAGTICDDITTVADALKEESPVLCAMFFGFVVVAAFMMLNMLIGILCEVVTAVSEAEKEKAAVSFLKERLLGILKEVDQKDCGRISKDEFESFVMHPSAYATFE